MTAISPSKRLRNDEVLEDDETIKIRRMSSSVIMPEPSHQYGALSVADQFLQLEESQCHELNSIQFPHPISYVYNPLIYAGHPHSVYVRTYCQGPKHCLFVGMNPGPFGMAQTGVPFGEINIVKDWLRIYGFVGKPDREHPKRQITGFSCKRNEVSGQRFWGLLKQLSGIPEVFFRHCFVHNYCPLMFTSSTGKNITPPSVALAERHRLQAICDAYLCRTIRLLNVRLIIAIGRYTHDRIVNALKTAHMLDATGNNIRVAFIMHPSPINPMANKDWAGIVSKKLQELDIIRYISPP